VTGFEL